MKKILVVDDEPHLQEMLKDILSLSDYSVVTAENGAEGLKVLEREDVDLGIADCAMPVMDGYELLGEIRANPLLATKPVIMLTVMSREADEIKGLGSGADDYITKPFKSSLLLARVKALLDRKKQSEKMANPLGAMGDSESLRREAERRLRENVPFAMIYADINNLKSFNSRYGFNRGDEVIRNTAAIVLNALRETGDDTAVAGNVGGDDFIVFVDPAKARPLCDRMLAMFDESIPGYYDSSDRAQGFIVYVDRRSNTHRMPIMTLAVGAVSTRRVMIDHYGRMISLAEELLAEAKKQGRSVCVGEL